MPNPFPGMDPFLEGSLWTSVHNDVACEIVRQLNPLLVPRYIALTTTRVVVVAPDSTDDYADRVPDIGIAKTEHKTPNAVRSGVAVAEPEVIQVPAPARIPQHYVTIRDVKSRRLVTAIEILSPSNKAGSGRRQYLRKRRRLMARRVHLLEIDLIRAGRPVQRLPRRPVGTYFAYLSRYHHRGAVEVWGMPLTAMLPTVKVPLRRNEPDVPLNLQRVLTAAYDGGCYDLLIDYCREPPGPLAEEDAAWLDARLREAGRRS